MKFTKEDAQAIMNDWNVIWKDLDNIIKDEFKRAKKILKEHKKRNSKLIRNNNRNL